MRTYQIKRFYQKGPELTEVIRGGLSLEEAQEHCEDPETSSRTCEDEDNVARTEEHGPWFDGYEEE
jgi:hypothetical protein